MKILNSKGQEIVLNEKETRHALHNQLTLNSLGYEINVTTLTTIIKKVTEQKFFEVAPADYVPVKVGQGAWSAALTTYRSFSLGGDFEKGIIDTGGNSDRLANADAAVDSLSIKVTNWAKQIGWALPDLELAAKSGNWDLVTAKEHARKKNWDLGIQKVAFLGSPSDTAIKGLLTQVGVTTDLTTITAPISSLTPLQLKTFVATVLDKYRTNCFRTAWPTHFVIPESDFIGLASQASADFPMKTVMELLLEAFKLITGNKSFQIKPLSYGDAAYHADFSSIAGKQVYALYNSEEESLRMDIPVDYTNTLANSTNNFQFQNVGYGQFTGVLAYRPAELLYFAY